MNKSILLVFTLTGCFGPDQDCLDSNTELYNTCVDGVDEEYDTCLDLCDESAGTDDDWDNCADDCDAVWDEAELECSDEADAKDESC